MKTGKAIKKPIPVEFIKLEITNILEVYKFINGCYPYGQQYITASEGWDIYERGLIESEYMQLKTLESGAGTQNANFGDYIIKGIDGECWPIKPDIFERTYDIVTL